MLLPKCCIPNNRTYNERTVNNPWLFIGHQLCKPLANLNSSAVCVLCA